MSLPEPRRVDSKIWQICAGPAVKIPKIGSKVYYFPQGHLEHACSSPNIETQLLLCFRLPSILCSISSVDLLADPQTDEVFAKLLLTPVTTDGGVQVQEPAPPEVPGQEDDNLVSFVKILKDFDANCVLFVPHECVRLILPKLDWEDGMQSHNISVTDIQGDEWKYKCVYRKKEPNTHRFTFTTGWSQFVTEKKLVAGDSVVFIKNSAGKISVGIRRNSKFPAAEEDGGKREYLTEKAVMDAVELAEKNMAFEVVYYPTANWCDFIVDASIVDEAMKNGWEPGMGVELCLNEDESSISKKPYFQSQGTISDMSGSPSDVPSWRMLQVNWDDPDILQNPNSLNPWQVDIYPILAHTSSHQQMPYSYPPTPPPLLQSSMSTSSFIPMKKLPYSTMGSLNQTLLNSDTFPDGMLGASHDHLSVSDSSKVLNDKGDGFNGNSSMAGSSGTLLDTELNIGSPKSAELELLWDG